MYNMEFVKLVKFVVLNKPRITLIMVCLYVQRKFVKLVKFVVKYLVKQIVISRT